MFGFGRAIKRLCSRYTGSKSQQNIAAIYEEIKNICTDEIESKTISLDGLRSSGTRHNLEIISFSEQANDILNHIGSNNIYCEISIQERLFLTELILRYKPAKILELGVSAGGSSVIMLNALSQIGKTKLISIDYLKYYYKDQKKPAGFIVDEYPDLKKRYLLYTGGTAAEFIEEIGAGIDFCLIDTQHIIPSEMIDFLLVFPFLKDNAIVVFHDVNLHTVSNWQHCNCNGMLISSISGQKLIPEHWLDFLNSDSESQLDFPNIAAVRLNKAQDSIWNIFNLLTQKWHYIPVINDLSAILKIFNKYYARFYVKFFIRTILHQISMERYQQ